MRSGKHARKDQRSEAAQSYRHLYGYRWQKARLAFLADHPLCVMCEKAGRITAANVVDHDTPHKGDEALFWSRSNWKPLCKPCHDRHKQSEERTGKARPAIGLDGFPIE